MYQCVSNDGMGNFFCSFCICVSNGGTGHFFAVFVFMEKRLNTRDIFCIYLIFLDLSCLIKQIVHNVCLNCMFLHKSVSWW